jgi:hypothetical protein
VHLSEPSSRKPFLLGDDPPGEQAEYGNNSKDDWRVIEAFCSNWKVERREEDSSEIGIPHKGNESQRPRPATKRPLGVLELSMCDECSSN